MPPCAHEGLEVLDQRVAEGQTASSLDKKLVPAYVLDPSRRCLHVGTGPPFPMGTSGLAAVMLDGGYFTKRFQRLHHRFPAVDDATDFCAELMRGLEDFRLYRAFFYDAEPYDRASRNPISGQVVNLPIRLWRGTIGRCCMASTRPPTSPFAEARP